MKAEFQWYELEFKKPAGTSRGVLHTKKTYLLTLYYKSFQFTGECAFFRGLSVDSELDYEGKLQWVCDNINEDLQFILDSCREFPSIQFGVEQVFKQKENAEEGLFFSSEFTQGKKGIQINGLIWMGSLDFMREQVRKKLQEKYGCIKLKIGVDWEGEYKMLQNLRREFPADQLELRVDANGGFTYEQAPKVLEQLAELQIHSIEQPIKAGQKEKMRKLCEETSLPIALDEELIGKFYPEQKEELLHMICPQYIIIKPSLVGGWSGSEEWIDIAEKQQIGWWVTSALESNIGLNAIAQWTATLGNKMPQGLGTGSLFTNNFPSRLEVRGEKLFYNP